MDLYEAPKPCRIYISPIEVRAKLEELGIPKSILVRAGQLGFAERANANKFDPVTAAGTDAWRYPVRIVREELVQLGWRLDDPKSLPLVISDEKKINLTVSSGDKWTGVFGQMPKTKNPKGSLLEAAIERNIRQAPLFPEDQPENIKKFVQTMEYPTWVYLLYITNDEIRAELSLPRSMDSGDHIDDWLDRIILDIALPDTLYEDVEPEEGPDITPEVVVNI